MRWVMRIVMEDERNRELYLESQGYKLIRYNPNAPDFIILTSCDAAHSEQHVCKLKC
jgi:hypothetical protein